MSKLYMADATLPDLFEFVRCEAGPVRTRGGAELWLSLPHDHNFPLYMTVRATPRLAEFIAGNSIYGDEKNLDQSHYLEIVFRDDGTALVLMMYQQIIGSRWLCIVPQSQVTEWVRRASTASIYEQMRAAGVPMESHESDLYVPVNDVTREIVKGYQHRANVKTFASQIDDGKLWYEIPFAFMPWWDARKEQRA